MKRLEIGPGDIPLDGWDTLDSDPELLPTHIAEWGGRWPLPIDTGMYDEVFCSHTIEHIPWNRTIAALMEVYRILKPGGLFEIWTVDFAVLVKAYQNQTPCDDWNARGLNQEMNLMRWLASKVYCCNFDSNEGLWHKALFDERYLLECLLDAGFSKMSTIAKRTRGHNHGAIDLGMKARK